MAWRRQGQSAAARSRRALRPARKAHPALLVPDLDGLRARLTAAGVATRDEADPPAGYRRFYADDPFGNRLEFLQREP